MRLAPQAIHGFLDPYSAACARQTCKTLHAALPVPPRLSLLASSLDEQLPEWEAALRAVAGGATSVELLVNLQLQPEPETAEQLFR